jgi:phage-related minor tail protein
LIQQYGVNTLLNKQEVVSKKGKEGDDGFAIIEAEITKLQNKLEDAVMNHDKPTVIQALGKQIDELTDKLAKLRHAEALALNPHLDDQLLTLDKPLITGSGKGTLNNGKESDDVSRVDLGPQKLLSDDTDAETKSMIQAAQAFKDYNDWLNRTRKAQKDFIVDTKNENLAARELTNTIGKGLVNAFESAMNGTQSFVQAMGKFIAQLIEKLVAAAAAAAILSVLLNATGIGGILGLSSSTTSFSGLFGSLSGLGGVMNSLPQHAEGGIATSASVGIFGEAGPEALIPLNRMHEFTGGGASGQNLEVTHRLSGADLLLTITRAQKQKSRLT